MVAGLAGSVVEVAPSPVSDVGSSVPQPRSTVEATSARAPRRSDAKRRDLDSPTRGLDTTPCIGGRALALEVVTKGPTWICAQSCGRRR
jgi:hypothetical protein